MTLLRLFALRLAPDGAVIRNVVLEGANPEHRSPGEARAAPEAPITAIERAERVR
jgi:hypothetical protein